jgi:DDE superfamily endonuclease
MVYLWCAVDAEGEVLDVLVQSKRDKRAALKLMRKLFKKMRFVSDKFVTDDLRSYGAAARDLGISDRHQRGRWFNNRVENSYQLTRRRDAGVQECGISPALSVLPRLHLQHLRRPAPPRLSQDAPGVPSLSDADVGREVTTAA